MRGMMMRRTFGRLLAALFICATALPAWAAGEMVPAGEPVVNQARQARSLTKSDSTVLIPTRGIYIGDAAACDVALLFVGDSVAVTFTNVQSGAVYPFQITKLMSTGTSCATVKALY